MKESKAQRYIVDKLRLHNVDVQRIENTFDRGIPDMNICFEGCELWIEMKSVKANKVSLRAEQMAWHARRIKHGGTVLTGAYHQNTKEYSISIPSDDFKELEEKLKAPKEQFIAKLLDFILWLSSIR